MIILKIEKNVDDFEDHHSQGDNKKENEAAIKNSSTR